MGKSSICVAAELMLIWLNMESRLGVPLGVRISIVSLWSSRFGVDSMDTSDGFIVGFGFGFDNGLVVGGDILFWVSIPGFWPVWGVDSAPSGSV